MLRLRPTGGVAVSAGYEFVRGMRLPRIRDRNLYYTGYLPNGQPTFGFYNPAVLQYNVEESTASASRRISSMRARIAGSPPSINVTRFVLSSVLESGAKDKWLQRFYALTDDRG
jgi:hypothetical protein